MRVAQDVFDCISFLLSTYLKFCSGNEALVETLEDLNNFQVCNQPVLFLNARNKYLPTHIKSRPRIGMRRGRELGGEKEAQCMEKSSSHCFLRHSLKSKVRMGKGRQFKE